MKPIVQQSIALWLSYSLLLTCLPRGFAFQTADPAAQGPPQAAALSTQQLEQIAAPIALYPDALIAQILPAATYPDQVVEAESWLQQNPNLTGAELAQQVDQQPWDPSIKALVQFPSVLANMKQNLAWTSELGDAYVNQQQELTQAIQTMRQRAKQAGNLKSTPQQKVEMKNESIVIDPVGTDVIYVPQYDPWLVYGYPLAVFPGWYPYPGLYLAGPGIEFGLGFGIGFFAGFGWGWHHWGYDWHHGGRSVFNHNAYFSHSRSIVSRHGFDSTRGFRRGGGSAGRQFGGHSHASAFSGFSHGGIARGNADRGQSSFGGFHGSRGFGGGGFHGGGRR